MRMIEKIMRSMRDTGLLDGMSDEDCDTLATAALEGMREPSRIFEAYIDSVLNKLTVGGNVKKVWQTMIDAALNE